MSGLQPNCLLGTVTAPALGHLLASLLLSKNRHTMTVKPSRKHTGVVTRTAMWDTNRRNSEEGRINQQGEKKKTVTQPVKQPSVLISTPDALSASSSQWSASYSLDKGWSDRWQSSFTCFCWFFLTSLMWQTGSSAICIHNSLIMSLHESYLQSMFHKALVAFSRWVTSLQMSRVIQSDSDPHSVPFRCTKKCIGREWSGELSPGELCVYLTGPNRKRATWRLE